MYTTSVFVVYKSSRFKVYLNLIIITHEEEEPMIIPVQEEKEERDKEKIQIKVKKAIRLVIKNAPEYKYVLLVVLVLCIWLFVLGYTLNVLTNDVLVSNIVLPPFIFVATNAILLCKIYGFSFKKMLFPTMVVVTYCSLLTIIVLGIIRIRRPHYQGGYRLADVVNGFTSRFSDEHMQERLAYSIAYPYSIAQRYVKITTGFYTFELTAVMQEVEKGMTFADYNNSLVVHLRLGDVMDANDTFYIKNEKYYKDAITTLPAEIQNVVLVGSDLHSDQHYKNDEDNPSVRYRDSVKDIFEQKGYEVSYRYNQEPDADMIYMAHAPYFLVGGGSFSHIASMLVEFNGGLTFGKGQSHAFFVGADNSDDKHGNWHK